MTTYRDFDRLSAYLDNQLPQAERAALEARLASEPALRAALRDLRLTVRALRALPAVKPPRNFTLTPAQAGAVPRRAPLFPVLRFATALSAVALVVVLAGDLGGGFLAASATREAATASGDAELAQLTVTEPAAEVALAEAPAATETPALEMDSMGGAGSTGTDEATAEVAFMAPEAAGTPTAESSAERTAPPTAEPSPKALEVTPTPAVEEAPPPPSATEAEDLYAYDTTPQTAAEPAGGLAAIRVIELALIMLTSLLGVAAWLARRA